MFDENSALVQNRMRLAKAGTYQREQGRQERMERLQVLKSVTAI